MGVVVVAPSCPLVGVALGGAGRGVTSLEGGMVAEVVHPVAAVEGQNQDLWTDRNVRCDGVGW